MLQWTNRRRWLQTTSLALAGQLTKATSFACAQSPSAFRLKYIVSSCLYGYTEIETVLGEVPKCGAKAIDIWPKVHGDQREQIDKIGRDRFAEMLTRYAVNLGCITQYKLGPFGLQDEMRFAKSFDCQTIVTGAVGPAGLQGADLKRAVRDFIEKMKPHLAVAEETGVTIAIENHANNLMHSAEALQYLFELRPSRHLAIAFAPYHLPQDEAILSRLLQDILPGVAVFYAWQHGNGSMEPMPKEVELLQLPGRGKLDFRPILQVLKQGGYEGWTSIFMHPFPRGIPILEPTAAVTAEVQKSRTYLDNLLDSH